MGKLVFENPLVILGPYFKVVPYDRFSVEGHGTPLFSWHYKWVTLGLFSPTFRGIMTAPIPSMYGIFTSISHKNQPFM